MPGEHWLQILSSGIHLWVEFTPEIDCLELYIKAIAKKIGRRPGKIYTTHDQFNNAIALSYGLVWDSEIEKALKNLGNISKSILSERDK